MARFIFLWGTFLAAAAASASADWVVFTDGQRTNVQTVEIAERAVHITTRAGKRWSVIREAVDVEATLAANQSSQPLEVVVVQQPPPVVSPPEARSRPPRPATNPTTPPPPPSQQTIVEREHTPAPLHTPDVLPPRAAPRQYRVSITINGLRGSDTFQLSDTNQFELFKEQARIDSVYSNPRPQGYEVGIQYRFAGPMALGATLQRFDQDRSASYSASLPHPFFFDRFRELSGTASGLTHEELAVHLDAVVTKTWGPLTLEGFGGPTWFETKTEVLVDVLYDEAFPYNEILFRGVEGRVFETRPLGYNVGASATFRVASIFGVDFGVRYSNAKTKLAVAEGREIELEAGGLTFGAGLRFLFP